MYNKQKTRDSGLGMISTLTLLLVVLKLFNLISISWLWVFSPIWISAFLVVLLVLGFYIVTKVKGKW